MKNNLCIEFGDFIRRTRIKNGRTAREVSAAIGWLPSNFSKLEHGALRPPQEGQKLRILGESIGLQPDSTEGHAFFDLASKATDSVPVDLADIISEEEAAPLLLRTIGNKRLNKDQIQRIIAIIRETSADTAKNKPGTGATR